MSLRLALIVNPRAGKGRGHRIAASAVAELRGRGLDFRVFTTTQAGEAVELARRADSGLILALGGDGTVQEVVNGIFGTGKVLGVIPAGSGNDLAKSLGIPSDPARALELALTGVQHPIDVGEVAFQTGAGPISRRYFVNGVGMGFDAAVAVRTASFRFLSGFPMYAAAVAGTLGRFAAPTFTASGDGGSFSGRKLLVAVGNGHSAGGGFLLTPHARPDDGFLDLCTIGELSSLGILRLVPSVLRGRHLERDDVISFRARRILIEADRGVPVHADGEILGTDVRRVELGIEPGALQVAGMRPGRRA